MESQLSIIIICYFVQLCMRTICCFVQLYVSSICSPAWFTRLLSMSSAGSHVQMHHQVLEVLLVSTVFNSLRRRVMGRQPAAYETQEEFVPFGFTIISMLS